MNVVQPADSGDLGAPQDAARHGRAAAMSRRRALAAAGRSALATTTASAPRATVVAADGVPPARLARAFSMQRRRQLTQGKQALNTGAPAFVVHRGGAG